MNSMHIKLLLVYLINLGFLNTSLPSGSDPLPLPSQELGSADIRIIFTTPDTSTRVEISSGLTVLDALIKAGPVVYRGFYSVLHRTGFLDGTQTLQAAGIQDGDVIRILHWNLSEVTGIIVAKVLRISNTAEHLQTQFQMSGFRSFDQSQGEELDRIRTDIYSLREISTALERELMWTKRIRNAELRSYDTEADKIAHIEELTRNKLRENLSPIMNEHLATLYQEEQLS